MHFLLDRSRHEFVVSIPKTTEPEALSSPVLPSSSYYHSLLENGAVAISSSFGSVGCIGIIAPYVSKNVCTRLWQDLDSHWNDCLVVFLPYRAEQVSVPQPGK